MGSGAVRAWARRWVQNPGVSAVLGVLLFALLFAAAFRDTPPASWAVRMNVFAVRSGEGFRIIDPDNESWDEAARLLQNAPGDVALIIYRSAVRREGWLAETCEVVIKAVEFDGSEIGLDRPPGSRGRARAAFVEWLGTAHHGAHRADAEDVAGGDVRRVTVLWSGYVVDGLVVGVFSLLLYSMVWISRVPAWLAATRRQRELARGRCPHCGYSVVGLREPLCPECGKSWDVTAEDPPVDLGARE